MIYAQTVDLFLVHAWRFHADWQRLTNLLDAHDLRRWRNFSLPWHDPALDPRSLRGGQAIRWCLEAQIIPAHAVLLLAGVWREPGVRQWLDLEIGLARKHGKPILALPAWGDVDVPEEVRERADDVIAWHAAAILGAVEAMRDRESPVSV